MKEFFFPPVSSEVVQKSGKIRTECLKLIAQLDSTLFCTVMYQAIVIASSQMTGTSQTVLPCLQTVK